MYSNNKTQAKVTFSGLLHKLFKNEMHATFYLLKIGGFRNSQLGFVLSIFRAMVLVQKLRYNQGP